MIATYLVNNSVFVDAESMHYGCVTKDELDNG